MNWQNAPDPLLAAVQDLALRFPRFDWTGIYFLRGDALELGPFVGAPTEHRRIPLGVGVCGRAVAENRDLNIPDVNLEANYLACSSSTRSELVCLIRDSKGRTLGQIDIDSHTLDAFDAATESAVRERADELGRDFAGLFAGSAEVVSDVDADDTKRHRSTRESR
jgi:GAF domain-containing protein